VVGVIQPLPADRLGIDLARRRQIFRPQIFVRLVGQQEPDIGQADRDMPDAGSGGSGRSSRVSWAGSVFLPVESVNRRQKAARIARARQCRVISGSAASDSERVKARRRAVFWNWEKFTPIP